MSDTAPTVDRETLARDFASAMQGQMEPQQIDAAVQSIQASTASYPATVTLGFAEISITITGGETFRGQAGPGGGTVLLGTVSTSDIDRLYADTTSFQFATTPVYLSVVFFDRAANVLGVCQAGGALLGPGIGGGTGSWS